MEIRDETAWNRYLSEVPYGLEVVRAVLWDTERYRGGGFITQPDAFYRINFFGTVRQRRREGNMLMPGCLYNPCSFLVDEIQIKGVTKLLSKNAMVVFQIGNKIYFEAPLEMFIRHQKWFPVRPALMIAPLVHFQLRLEWNGERYQGGNQPKIEVRLVGQMARPIQ